VKSASEAGRAVNAVPIGLTVGVAASLVLSVHLGFLAQTLTMTVTVAVVAVSLWYAASRRGASLEGFLLLPTMFSAWQNVFLLPVARDIDTAQLQVLVISNYLLSVVMLVVLQVRLGGRQLTGSYGQLVRLNYWILVALSVYGLALAALSGVDTIGAFASLRNLTSPMLFLALGLAASRWTTGLAYARLLSGLMVAVVIFTVYERFTPGFWQNVDLGTLWEKKGIPVNAFTGLPNNFYSSEMVNGRQQRRAVGPFADPVNLGTFLFAGIIASWYASKTLRALLGIGAAALAISKGAALGLLIAAAVWVREYRSRFEYLVAFLGVAVVGVVLYQYTLASSTGSTTRHVGGFTAAFTEFPHHPLGRGFGSVGVLAGLFAESAESDISESGVGVVIGQLGIVGIVGYLIFFGVLLRRSARLTLARDRMLGLTLTLAFLTNALFNEVALSPNSSAPTFILLGLVLGYAAAREGLEQAGSGSLSGADTGAEAAPSRLVRPRSAAATAPNADNGQT
jgi:hypothetical protein